MLQLAAWCPALSQCQQVCGVDLQKVLLPTALCTGAFGSCIHGQGAALTDVRFV